jgi:acyl-coenzyme A synthetase/AMP-(fatty) acid ligase
VKIRGFRIELGEIETRLLDHADPRSGGAGAGCAERQATGGYLVSDAEHGALREALKAHLKAQLPDYMVPAHLIVLDSMPLTANGKLDRRALPAPDPEPIASTTWPRATSWSTLAQIWCAC